MPTSEEITRHHDPAAEDPWAIEPPAPEPVTILPYDPEWPRRYQHLSAAIHVLTVREPSFHEHRFPAAAP